MADACWELFDSGTLTETRFSATSTLRYFVRKATDRNDALAAADVKAPASLPAINGTLHRRTITATPLGNDNWEVVFSFGRTWGQIVWNHDFSAQSSKIVQSLATVASYARPGFTAPNFQGVIGVSGTSINGTEVPTPKFDFSATVQAAKSAVNSTLMAKLQNLGGHVNDRSETITFWTGCSITFAAGELLYLGAQLNEQPEESQINMTLNFSGSPNAINLQVGEITGIAKRGWDHIWVWHVDDVDASTFSLIKRPQACFVEQVSYYGHLGSLGVW